MNIWCKINDYQQDITYIIRIFIYKSPTYSQDSRKSIESKKYAICVRGSTYLVYLVYFLSHAEDAEDTKVLCTQKARNSQKGT